MTQKQILLEHLKKGKTITSRKAMAYFNIIRLSAIIYFLRKDGWNIKDIRKPSLFNDSTYKVYYLDKNNQRRYEV